MLARRDKLFAVMVRRLVQACLGDGVRMVRIALGCSVLVFCGDFALQAQEIIDPRLEYNVKAVSLYAFGRYVTWPEAAFPSAKSPFVIGTIGGNPFGDALARIAQKKTLNGRAIVVREIEKPEQCVECHILFVTQSVSQEVETALFQQAAGKPVLLVGESPGFAERGGVINFYHSGSNVRFELNPDKGVENQLSLNAKLLTLGTRAATRK
jgi:YfiR/HmsC-like